MNLGNQNSKYSWRIRDLENPQTGTQFANSVLMYKITENRVSKNLYQPIIVHFSCLKYYIRIDLKFVSIVLKIKFAVCG